MNGKRRAEVDLESIDVPWFVQPTAVLVCEDCLGELREAEEICEDFDAGERLRRQLDTALAVT